jgi:hypothetical protein
VAGFDSVQAFNVAFRDHIESHPTHDATRHGKYTGELLQELKGPVAALEQIIIERGMSTVNGWAWIRHIRSSPRRPSGSR